MVWKTHPKYKKYEISTSGLVRGIEKKILLKSRLNKCSKPSVSIHHQNKTIQKFVGELVLETHKGKNPYPNGSFINIDNDVYNNKLSNLQWTPKKGSKAKSVVQLTQDGQVVKIWDSISYASINGKFCEYSIILCCKNKIKHHGGYVWRYCNGYMKYVDMAITVVELKTNEGEFLSFNGLEDAYDYLKNGGITRASYKSFYSLYTQCKNKKKLYLGYYWKEKRKKIKVQIR